MSEKPARSNPEQRPAREEEAERKRNAAPVCDLCGKPMYEVHCRIICPACGYQRDCSDP